GQIEIARQGQAIAIPERELVMVDVAASGEGLVPIVRHGFCLHGLGLRIGNIEQGSGGQSGGSDAGQLHQVATPHAAGRKDRVRGGHGSLLVRVGHWGFRRRRPLPTSSTAVPARMTLPMKVAWIERPSSSRPPTTAPSRMEVWMAATIKLPAASGASSTFWDIQVIQITEMAVFIAPHTARNRPAAIGEAPRTTSPRVQAPMTRAGSLNTGATSPIRKRPQAHVPTKPAQPSASSRTDSTVTLAPVTPSRKGRR